MASPIPGICQGLYKKIFCVYGQGMMNNLKEPHREALLIKDGNLFKPFQVMIHHPVPDFITQLLSCFTGKTEMDTCHYP